MVLMHDTLSECALQMYEVSLKYLWRLSSYRADTILWWTDPWTNARGGIYMHELCVHDALSECALQMYEVSLNYL